MRAQRIEIRLGKNERKATAVEAGPDSLGQVFARTLGSEMMWTLMTGVPEIYAGKPESGSVLSRENP